MADLQTLNLILFVAGTFTAALVTGVAGFAFGIVAASVWLHFLTPAQATCNYATLFLRNTASLLSDPVATGTRLRFNVVAIDDVPGAESVPSQSPFVTPDTNQADAHGPLHVNPYPNTASPGQPRECSAGNEPYLDTRAAIGNPPGNAGVKTEITSRRRK